MKGKRFTDDEQITYALRQAEGGPPVADFRGIHEPSEWIAQADSHTAKSGRRSTRATAPDLLFSSPKGSREETR